jgi:hypothetical protein
VLGAGRVGDRLGLDAARRPWLDSPEAVGPPPGGVPLPRGADAAALLRRLGVAEVDAAAVLEALPAVEARPELRWPLERSYHQTIVAGTVKRAGHCGLAVLFSRRLQMGARMGQPRHEGETGFARSAD